MFQTGLWKGLEELAQAGIVLGLEAQTDFQAGTQQRLFNVWATVRAERSGNGEFQGLG